MRTRPFPASNWTVSAPRRCAGWFQPSQNAGYVREGPNESIWAFMGTFGLVGWTVAIPTLAGLALGVFLDNRTESERSFTIMFLVLGIALGCATAWYWIRRESSGDRR